MTMRYINLYYITLHFDKHSCYTLGPDSTGMDNCMRVGLYVILVCNQPSRSTYCKFLNTSRALNTSLGSDLIVLSIKLNTWLHVACHQFAVIQVY